MIRFRQSAPLGVLFALGACVAAPPPSYVAAPGQGKDAAAFQRDDEACHKQADGSTSDPSGQVAGTSTAARPNSAAIYAQCMGAKGNAVTHSTYPAYPAYAYANPYAYGYPYGYPYAYPYAYPFLGYPEFVGGPFVGLGFGFCCGGYHGHFHGGYRR